MNRTHWFCCALLVLNASPLQCAQPRSEVAPGTPPACSALAGTTLGGGEVMHASMVQPPYTATWDEIPGGKQNISVPFCLLEGRSRSGPDSDIRFEVWLPLAANWNGRLLGVGASRSLGSINHLDLGLGVARGFAAVATDNGHHGFAATDLSWALGHPQGVTDFAYRAHHLATESAKQIVRRFYGRQQHHAYFVGCSQGGYMGMLAALGECSQDSFVRRQPTSAKYRRARGTPAAAESTQHETCCSIC